MIKFKGVRWKNLLSTGNVWTSVELDKCDSTLILGRNGAGKSTLCDALCFLLYGKPYRKINIPQLVNSINGKHTVVEGEFYVGTSKYFIRRGLKPAIFEIYKDGVLVKQPGSAKEYQDMLEKTVLKMGFKAFCQIVILGNASFIPFMALPAPSRREVIEDILDLQIFSTMNSLLKSRVTDNKNSLQDVRYELEIVDEKITLQKKYIRSLEEDSKEVIRGLKAQISETKQTIDQNTGSIADLQKKIADLELEVEDYEKLSKKLRALESLERQLEDKISKLKKEIKFYEDNDTCPTCRQKIADDFKRPTIDTRKSSLEKTTDGLGKLGEEFETVNDELNRMAQVNKQINEYQHKITTHNATVTTLNKSLGKILEEIEKHKKQTKVKQSDLDAIETLKTSKKDMETKREDLTIMKNALDIAGALLKDGGIKTKIIRQYIPIINKLLAKYFAAMDFFIDFQVDENFNETIKSRYRDEFSYGSFSEGEKQRIDLCLTFVWRAVAKIRNSSASNILILDETLDKSLDIQGGDDLIRIIGSMLPDTNVFIISHKQQDLEDKFNRTLTFAKVKNFSQMSEKVNS